MNPKNFNKWQEEFQSIEENKIFIEKIDGSSMFITSVHGLPHLRNKIMLPPDHGSAKFSFFLAKALNANIAIENRPSEIDSNFHLETDFKANLASAVDSLNHKPSLLIDIHTMHAARHLDCELGTINGSSIFERSDYVSSLLDEVRRFGFLVDANRCFNGNLHDGETITKFSSVKLKIPTIQIEISGAILIGDDLQTIHARMKLIEAIRLFAVKIHQSKYEVWAESEPKT